MLTELTISNFAIINQLRLTFAPGFNVLTGETGAGKSIIVDALSLALGERASEEMVRSDADAARVEA
ncbi:MAG: AAA family ATPase, partial [Chloroflexota bacterium]